jgi:hypothetical protein
VGCVANLSEELAASIFRVEVSSVRSVWVIFAGHPSLGRKRGPGAKSGQLGMVNRKL